MFAHPYFSAQQCGAAAGLIRRDPGPVRAAFTETGGPWRRISRTIRLVTGHKKPVPGTGINGGPCRIRTYDQVIKSHLLYQLS
jgi:hypothetical protein